MKNTEEISNSEDVIGSRDSVNLATPMSTTKLNRRERKAAQLLAHYQTCERLALALGMAPEKIDGKKISVALFKLEREAHAAMEHACSYPERYYSPVFGQFFRFSAEEIEMDIYKTCVTGALRRVLGKLPPGFFINADPRGFALKIDPENPRGQALIEAVGLPTDWGSNGLLSPEIKGEAK